MRASLLAIALLTATTAGAADTTEVFELGASDVELFAGLDGLSQRSSDRALSTDMVIGFGLTPRLSASLGSTLASDHHLTRGETALTLGIFGTVLEREHADLDLFATFGVGGAGDLESCLTPGLELNLDLEPDQSSAGAYLRVITPILGEVHEDGIPHRHLDLELNPGAYVVAGDGHQLLVEALLSAPGLLDQTPSIRLDRLALGYNVGLQDHIELISQVHVDLGDAPSPGFSTGIIVTLPTPATATTDP